MGRMQVQTVKSWNYTFGGEKGLGEAGLGWVEYRNGKLNYTLEGWGKVWEA